MHDPLDLMSINDFLRILYSVRDDFELLVYSLGFDPNEPRMNEDDLWRAMDITVDAYWGGSLRE